MLTINNEVKLRERLLVEKCLRTIILDFQTRVREVREYESVSIIDLKLDFLSFLTTNKEDEVKYGIEFLTKNEVQFKEALMYLKPMILEYQTYGLNGTLQCSPITCNDCITIEDVKEKGSFWRNLKFWR